MKVKPMKNNTPKIYMTEVAKQKMETYIVECNEEVGWLATVSNEGLDYVIEDTFLFKQQVHATTCEITTEGLTDFANEILLLPDGMEIWNNIRCWGHSHVNMGVFASAQDDKQMEIFEDTGHDFFIRLIGNKKGAWNVTLYDYKNRVIWEEMSITTIFDENKQGDIQVLQDQIKILQEELQSIQNASLINKEEIKTEIKEKVTKFAPTVYYGGRAYGSYGSNVQTFDESYDYSRWWDTGVKKNKKKDTASVKTMEEEIENAYNTGDTSYIEDILIQEEIFEFIYMTPREVVTEAYETWGEIITIDTASKLIKVCETYVNNMMGGK